jgi:amino acid adenylation domain-containing protein
VSRSPVITRSLASGFLSCAEELPDRPALSVAGEELSYGALRERAAAIAATLQAHPADEGPLGAVFAYRSPAAFAGVLGTLMAGRGYVPLNRTLPPARTRLMLQRSRARCVVVDAGSAGQLPEVLAGLDAPFTIVAPDHPDPAALAAALPGHHVLGPHDLARASAWAPPAVDADALAYLLFTSGSTGAPKGVVVAQRNVFHYVDVLVERYEVGEEDRFSQTHDMTFDNSVLDMFVPWERGACVCCPSPKALIKPGGFIRGERLTTWFSVPSTAIFMRRLGELKPGSYPTLRWGLFAGEPLPLEVARAWAAAAPGCTVENLYGPTEVTVDCTLYRWDSHSSPTECEHGVVPIGFPLPDMTILVAGPELREVAPGEVGELLVAGPQVALGYWEDPDRTAASFVVPPGRGEVFYRTGDRVRRPRHPDGPLTYLGRADHQIKVRGVRIELGEVEAAVRDATGADAVVAIGWPPSETGYDGIVAFVGTPELDAPAVRARVAERLGAPMVPRNFVALAELPLNSSGKFDRGALRRSLEERA